MLHHAPGARTAESHRRRRQPRLHERADRGQLAGAFYGAAGIPERWRTWMAMRDDLRRLAFVLMR